MTNEAIVAKANAYSDMVNAYTRLYGMFDTSHKAVIDRCKAVYLENGFGDEFAKDRSAADTVGQKFGRAQYNNGEEINLLAF